MSIWYDVPVATRRSMDEFTAPFWDVIGAQSTTVWKESPLQSYADRVDLERERMGDPVDMGMPEMGMAPIYRPRTPVLTQQDADSRIADAGLAGRLKFTTGMREGELDLLIREKRRELSRKDIMSRAQGGALQSMVGFGASLLTALADPVNVASAFIPVVGPSRYAYMLGKAGTVVGRTGVRFGVGGVEGAVGQALLEPLIASTQAEFQREYGLLHSFMNIAFGGAFGAGLHGAGGAVMDAIRPGRAAFFRSYARWADETDIIAREYGLDLSPRIDLFRAELQGRIEEGQFGAATRQAWERYRGDTADLGKEFGVEIVPTPDDFMRWLRLRRDRPKGAKAVEGDIGKPPRETIPEYDVPGQSPGFRSFFDDADVAPVGRAAVREAQPSIYKDFLDQVGADARETAFRYAASRLAWGKVADALPIYHAFGMQRRLSEATQLAGPEARAAVEAMTTAQVRVNPGIWGDGFGYRMDYGDVGPRATLRPEGLYRGDKVVWERFGEEQFAEPRKVTKVDDKGRVKIDGWQQWIPKDQVRLAEAGPAARPHTVEIEWGDLWAQVSNSQAQMPALARQQAARDLLGVLRDEQLADPAPLARAMAEKPQADLLYVAPEREAMAAATVEVKAKAAADRAEALAPTKPPKPTEPEVLVKNIEAEPASGRTTEDHVSASLERVKTPEEAVAMGRQLARAQDKALTEIAADPKAEAIRGEIDEGRAERQAVSEGTGSAGKGEGDESQRAVTGDDRPGAQADDGAPAAGAKVSEAQGEGPAVDPRLAEAEATARAAAEARGELPAFEKAMAEADEAVAKAEAEAQWLEAYAACVMRTT